MIAEVLSDQLLLSCAMFISGNGNSHSIMGQSARRHLASQSTMWLDLGDDNDDWKKYLILHQFGHVLGLGREHQRSEVWQCLRSFINESVMRMDLGIRMLDFETDQLYYSNSQSSEYDPDSIMHFR